MSRRLNTRHLALSLTLVVALATTALLLQRPTHSDASAADRSSAITTVDMLESAQAFARCVEDGSDVSVDIDFQIDGHVFVYVFRGRGDADVEAVCHRQHLLEIELVWGDDFGPVPATAEAHRSFKDAVRSCLRERGREMEDSHSSDFRRAFEASPGLVASCYDRVYSSRRASLTRSPSWSPRDLD